MLDQLLTSNSLPKRLALTLCLALASSVASHAQTTTRARRVGTQPAAKTEAKKSSDTRSADGSKNAATQSDDWVKSDGAAKSNDTEWVEPAVKTDASAPRVETAEAELQRRRAEIADASPEGRAKLQRALIDRLVELNQKEEALSELRLMIHEDRFDPAFFYNTGNALARLGDANAAADAYRKAVSQRKGNYSRALNNLGVVLTRQGRWDEAFDALVAALTQENFTYAEASYNLGRLYLLRGDANLAIREWGRTLRLQPDHAEAAAALARAYAEDGDTKRGLAVLENFTARASQTGGGVPRAISYAREEINSGAESEDVIKVRREDAGVDGGATPNAAPNTSPRVGVVSSRSNSPRSSSARSFSVDPQTYTLLQSARDASDDGKLDEAVRRYRNVLSRSGGYLPPANLELSFALINLHRMDEAVAALTPVTTRDGARYPIAFYHLARLYERQGQFDLAAENFTRAAAFYGDNAPQMFSDLSRVREKMNDTAGALAAMESYVKAISQQGSIPDWATERLNTLREKAKAATPKP